ncbi:hypothetical protein LARV_01266 [Longilinea arvoryzae]|uniref:Uncharacterized protein n=1 Tax=Longilinea arvoryzae TaxID=360412 RepID=A0A0S7BH49_9CHLR|nr:hypothetical protein [Longilinea arvoryzae]GAP13512.1 hypothetical protein LARV_01266 [Longilinea arvoryzae]
MKESTATKQVFALLAMSALIAAASYVDQLLIRLRIQTAKEFVLLPGWWGFYALGLLTVLLAFLLALWVIDGSARGPMIHWLFLIFGLLISFYAPLVAFAGMHGLIPESYRIPILSGDHVLYTARILAVAGLLGLLLKRRKPVETT